MEDHLPGRDAAQLVEAPPGVAPVLEGEHGEGGVEGAVGHRQRLRDRPHRGGRRPGPVGEHDARRLDRDDAAGDRLVGAGAGPDVQDRAGVAERGVQARREPRLGAAVPRVAGPDLLVEPAGGYAGDVGRASPSLR